MNDAIASMSVLGYSALLNRVIPPRAHILANIAAASIAVALARAGGASWYELALSPANTRAGLRTGLVAAAPVVATTAALAAMPRTSPQFRDERVSHAPHPVFEIALRIPLGTALCEELLFRSALLAHMERSSSRRRAVAISSAVFGLWHLLPAYDARNANPERAGVSPVVSTLATTAAAGVVFAWLRYRGRSVLAPVVVHTAINASAFGAARLLQRRARVTFPNARTTGRRRRWPTRRLRGRRSSASVVFLEE
jgi:membrane protease YdiL (CAAX protease family)